MINKRVLTISLLSISIIYLFIVNNIYADAQTFVNFAVSERTEVYEDTLQANLSISEDNKDPVELQKKINDKMKIAVEEAKKFSTVQASTEGYNVYQNTPPDQESNTKKEPITWHGNQQLIIKSKSQEDLLKLAGQLQAQGLLMQDLRFSLSADVNEKTKDELLAQTIKKLQEKATLLTSLLNKKKSQIVELNIDNSNMSPMPMMNRAVLLSSGAPVVRQITPVAEPAKVEVKLNINAKILIE